MQTLHELAVKLQEFIIEEQLGHNRTRNIKIRRYNNLKLEITSDYDFPNIIVTIGISKASYNVETRIKVDGGLGSDEKFIRKWLTSSDVSAKLKVLYINLTTAIEDTTDEVSDIIRDIKSVRFEGEAGEVKNKYLTFFNIYKEMYRNKNKLSLKELTRNKIDNGSKKD